ncbi:epimerase [Thioclava sp. SK-1]|uniref:epimerase n=1 Tax=Thioclava sp. SK-1 TaxID=1889770 RepID=UPI00114CF6DB|nr:epimerase [Thioclava sp. SK-1]
MSRRILILGMGGLFGAACARAFRAAGWDVDRYRRGSDMSVAARGARWIVNAMNPPATADLQRELPELTQAVIAASRNSGASIMVPGNFLIYGRQPAPWGPDMAAAPVTQRGHLRAEAEARYRDAIDRERAIVILRAGDFVMPGARNTLMNRVILSGLSKGYVTALGPASVPHIHADLEDMTQIAVSLAETADRHSGFLEVPYPGARFSAQDLAAELEEQLNRKINLRGYHWGTDALCAPFSVQARQMRANRYLYKMPHAVDDTVFRVLFPDHRVKSLQRIVFEHLYFRGMKVVPQGQAAREAPRLAAHGQAMLTQTIL